MPGVGRQKDWSEMTRREIIGTLTAFIIIGGSVMAGALYQVLKSDLGWFVIIPVSAIFGISYGALGPFRAGLRELKRRTPPKQ